jgi:hypothetical protein
MARLKPDVDVDAIPFLRPAGWKLYSAAEWFLGGAVPKNYLVFGDPESPHSVAFVAKRPRKMGPMECVTEQMISCVGRLLPLKVAKSRLVRLPVPQGSAPDVRFLSRSFVVRGKTALKHGVELAADYFSASPNELAEVFNLADKKEERSFYTLEFMLAVLDGWGRTDRERRSLRESFGRMVAFDALVGAQDRHAQNWGVIEFPTSPDAPRLFAPLYDTARGFFWDHSDDAFRAADAVGGRLEFVRRYAQRSKPVFGASEITKKLNHFELVEYAVSRLGKQLRGPICQIIQDFSPKRTERLLRREVGKIVSGLRIDYILALLKERHRILREIVPKGIAG